MNILTRNPEKFITAKRLYVLQHQSAAMVAKAVNVTEKTVGKWISDNNWKQELLDDIQKHNTGGAIVSNSFLIEDLKAYLNEVTPHLYLQIKRAIENYQTILKAKI